MFDAIFSDAERRRFCFTGIEAAAIAAIASTAVSAYGAYEQGQQASAASKYNQQVQQQNAAIAQQQAQTQAQIDKQQTTKRLGEIAATYGASGVDVNQGTPLDVMSDQAATGELTRQLDLYRGKLSAIGATDQANLAGTEAQQASEAGYLRAGSTLLAGGGQAYRTYYAGTPKSTAKGY